MADTKLTGALTSLDKAREAALQAALADRAYRTLPLFDDNGPIARAVDRAKRLTRTEPPAKK